LTSRPAGERLLRGGASLSWLGHARSRAAAHTGGRGVGPGIRLERLRTPNVSPEPHRPIRRKGGYRPEASGACTR
jgi:hypothetical protein